MNKSLFDEKHKHTTEAFNLEKDIREHLQNVFDKWTAEGYSPREIAHVLAGLIHELESLKCL